jgi:GDPmannose 4,6-dehydratase
MKRALITGAAGQDGTYLTELLLSKGYDVWGVVGPEPGDYLEWATDQGERLHVCEADLTDGGSLSSLVRDVVPNEVYNFAAISAVGLSWERPALVADVDATGVARLVEALHTLAPAARLCQATSAEIFGYPTESPQTEMTSVRPISPYGSAKAYSHFLMQNAREGWGMFACSAVLYNHESPRRPRSFVTRKITDAVARIKAGLATEVRLGNLDAERDWGFAGDYVDGMRLMLQNDRADDYVLATGVTHSVREFCEAAFSHVGLEWSDHVVVDPGLFRSVDRQAPRGDAGKARRELGWEPTLGFGEVVAMMVDADLERVLSESR